MEALRRNSDAFPKPSSRNFPDFSASFQPFRHGPHVVRLAGSLPDLEACLALERRSPAQAFRSRLAEPTAVPDCDFLMAADLGARLQGVCRLLPRRPEDVRHALPGAPRSASGDPRFAGPAALLTALRYSNRGVLEVGRMALAAEAGGEAGRVDGDAGKAVEALWEGVAGYMAARGFGYALGRERVTPPEGLALEEVLAILHDDHGLHPDLETGTDTETRPDWGRHRTRAGGFRAGGPEPMRARPGALPGGRQSHAHDWLPKSFQEGLQRGIHLIGSPVPSADAGLEFAWVASSELLRRSAGSASRSAGMDPRSAGRAA